MPMALTEPHAAIALGRSDAGKTSAMMDSVLGIMNAAPTPMNARSAMSCVALVTSGASAEPTPNSARPMTSISRRPYRSDRAPASSSRPAKMRM